MALLVEVSRIQPVVLCFDDVHGADPSTTDLIGYVARRVDEERILLMMMTEWPGLPVLAATHGGQIDSLIGWIHGSCSSCSSGGEGSSSSPWSVFRKSRNPVANYTGVTSHASDYSEIGVAPT